MTVRIGVVGLGYWGQNYPRVLRDVPGARLSALVDEDKARLERAGARWPDVPRYASIEEMLDAGTTDAVVVGTPAATHFEVGMRCLEAGLHLIVEKPLATTGEEARKLDEFAREQQKVLLVGHTFLYSTRVQYVRDFLAAGELGKVRYLYSRRLNLGKVRNDVDALWNFGPHDVSIAIHVLGTRPARVGARTLACLGRPQGDVAFLHLEFPGPVWANIHVSWLDPQKVRELTIVGSRKMLIYDDVDSDGPIRIYDAGVEPDSEGINFDDYAEYQMAVRKGDVLIPFLASEEPLVRQCAHFVRCIEEGEEPLTPGSDGVAVVEVLEAASTSAARRGVEVKLAPS